MYIVLSTETTLFIKANHDWATRILILFYVANSSLLGSSSFALFAFATLFENTFNPDALRTNRTLTSHTPCTFSLSRSGAVEEESLYFFFFFLSGKGSGVVPHCTALIWHVLAVCVFAVFYLYEFVIYKTVYHHVVKINFCIFRTTEFILWIVLGRRFSR